MPISRKAKILQCVPYNWLDGLLTGDKAVIGKPPYTGRDIENVCLGIRQRIEKACAAARREGK